jgi:hypothetical protein
VTITGTITGIPGEQFSLPIVNNGRTVATVSETLAIGTVSKTWSATFTLSTTTATRTVNNITISSVITTRFGGATNYTNLDNTSSTTITVNALPLAKITLPAAGTVVYAGTDESYIATITGTITAMNGESYSIVVWDEVGGITSVLGTYTSTGTVTATNNWSITGTITTTTSSQTVHTIKIGSI